MLDAGRGAAVSAAASRLERISDRLAERTAALGGGSQSRADEEDEDDEEWPPGSPASLEVPVPYFSWEPLT